MENETNKFDDDAPLNPWDQQPNEHGKAYGAFSVYRDMGLSRSLRAAHAKGIGKPSNGSSQWNEWSRKFKWTERVRAFDLHNDRQAQAAREEAIREMAKRHATVANNMIVAVAQRLKDFDPKTLKPADMVRFVEAGFKVERISRGQPAEHTRADTTTINIDLSQLTDEELDALDRINKRLAGAAGPAGEGTGEAPKG